MYHFKHLWCLIFFFLVSTVSEGTQLKNLGNGLCASVLDKDYDGDGVYIRMLPCNASIGQIWRKLGSNFKTMVDQCLTIPVANDGNSLTLSKCSDSYIHRFTVNGSKIIHQLSGKCVEALPNKARIRPCEDNAMQNWVLFDDMAFKELETVEDFRQKLADELLELNAAKGKAKKSLNRIEAQIDDVKFMTKRLKESIETMKEEIADLKTTSARSDAVYTEAVSQQKALAGKITNEEATVAAMANVLRSRQKENDTLNKEIETANALHVSMNNDLRSTNQDISKAMQDIRNTRVEAASEEQKLIQLTRDKNTAATLLQKVENQKNYHQQKAMKMREISTKQTPWDLDDIKAFQELSIED